MLEHPPAKMFKADKRLFGLLLRDYSYLAAAIDKQRRMLMRSLTLKTAVSVSSISLLVGALWVNPSSALNEKGDLFSSATSGCEAKGLSSNGGSSGFAQTIEQHDPPGVWVCSVRVRAKGKTASNETVYGPYTAWDPGAAGIPGSSTWAYVAGALHQIKNDRYDRYPYTTSMWT